MFDSASILQFLLSGATSGCAYALVALAIVQAANVSGVINLAQGEYVAVGGLVFASLAALGMPIVVCCIAAASTGVVLGAIQERLTVEPARESAAFVQITVSLGVAVVIRGTAYLVYGKDPVQAPGFSGDNVFFAFGAILPLQALWVWAGTAVLLALVFGLLSFTMLGRAIRACSINRRAAQLVGVNPRAMTLAVFMATGALSAIGGALIAPLTLASWDAGVTIGLKGLIAAIFGNFRSPVRAVAAGLAIGIAEAMIAGFGSSAAKDVVLYSLLLASLLILGGVFARGRDSLRLGSSY